MNSGRRTSVVESGHTQVVRGKRNIRALGNELDALAYRCGVGVSGSAGWIFPELAAVADEDSWTVIARHPSGVLAAAATFVNVMVADVWVARLAGTDGGYEAAPLAMDEASARLLARVIAGEMLRRRLSADLGPVTRGSLLLRCIAEGLPGADLIPSAAIPRLRRGSGLAAGDYLSPGLRKSLRKAANRMAADGIVPRIVFTQDLAQVRGLLPAMEVVYRNRDHEGLRSSSLDSAVGRTVWRDHVLSLLDAGVGEVAVLYLNDVFTAYVLGVRDRSWYGIRDGRFDTTRARYSPGRVLEAAVLQRVLDDSSFDGIDWMNAVASDSLIASNDAVPAWQLLSSAPPTVPVQRPYRARGQREVASI